MENTFERKKYFLREPVEYHLRNLASAFEEMSKNKTFNKAVRVSYQICGQKLREQITLIIRDDNHNVTKLNEIDSLVGAWESIDEKINPTKK